MRIPIAPQFVVWYATRFCEFVNLELDPRSWRSLFFEDAKDNTYKKRFKKAVESQTRKIPRSLLKSFPSVAQVQKEVVDRFTPPRSKTFAAVQGLQEEMRKFLQEAPAAIHKRLRALREAKPEEPLCQKSSQLFQSLDSLTQKISSFPISVAPNFGIWGGEYSLSLECPDLRSELYLLCNLALDSRIGQCARPSCGRFFVARRRGKKLYCSPECAEGITAKERVRNYRERRAKWEEAKKLLNQLLADMDAIERKQKLQRPRSERELLAESGKALEKAQAAFVAAFPLKKGQSYEEGKAFLEDAEKKILRLRKRVKGY